MTSRHDYTIDLDVVRAWIHDLWADYRPEWRGSRVLTRSLALWSLLGALIDILLRRH